MRTALFLSLVFLGFHSFADELWHNRTLRSQEGIEIAFDYKFRCQSFARGGHIIEQRLADPVWINVRGVPGNHVVIVDIEFYTKTYTTHGGRPPELVRSYNYYDRSLVLEGTTESRFTQFVNSMVTREDDSAAGYGLDVIQKVRVQIDGRSLTDPMNGTEWFQLQLDDHQGCLTF